MEINLGDERIMVLHARYSADQIREKANAKRIEAFGMIAKLIQRVQPEDIKIAAFQKRFEPFWFVVASSRYVYDRCHKYHVEVAPKVLENDKFFDFSADAAGTLIPGANLVVKLGRMAAKKAIH